MMTTLDWKVFVTLYVLIFSCHTLTITADNHEASSLVPSSSSPSSPNSLINASGLVSSIITQNNAKTRSRSMTSVADAFVELTGTFVPYEQSRPFQSASSPPSIGIPLYSSSDILTTATPVAGGNVIEITGTFLPGLAAQSVRLAPQPSSFMSSLRSESIPINTTPQAILRDRPKLATKWVHQINVTASKVPVSRFNKGRFVVYNGISTINGTIYNFIFVGAGEVSDGGSGTQNEGGVRPASSVSLSRSPSLDGLSKRKPVIAIYEADHPNHNDGERDADPDDVVLKKHFTQHEVAVNVNENGLNLTVPRSLAKLAGNSDMLFGSGVESKHEESFDAILLKTSTIRVKYSYDHRSNGEDEAEKEEWPEKRAANNSGSSWKSAMNDNSRHKNEIVNILVNTTSNAMPENVILHPASSSPSSSRSSDLLLSGHEDSKTIKASKVKLISPESGLQNLNQKADRFVAYGSGSGSSFVEKEKLEAATNRSLTWRSKGRSSKENAKHDQLLVSSPSGFSVHLAIQASHTELLTRTVHGAEISGHELLAESSPYKRDIIDGITRSTPPLATFSPSADSVPVYQPASSTPSLMEATSQANTGRSPIERPRLANRKVLDTTTIFGFIDFTTTISGTKVIFSPHTGAPKLPERRQSASSSLTEIHSASSVGKSRPRLPIKTRLTSEQSSTIQASKSIKEMKTLEDENIILPPKVRPGKYESIDLSALRSNKNRPNSDPNNPFKYPQPQHVVASTLSPLATVTATPPLSLPTGLLSSLSGTVDMNNTLTEWTTLVIGTFIQGTYAHILQSKSRIYEKLAISDPPQHPFEISPSSSSSWQQVSSSRSFMKQVSVEASKQPDLVAPSNQHGHRFTGNTYKPYEKKDDHLPDSSWLASTSQQSKLPFALPTLKGGHKTITSGFILPKESESISGLSSSIRSPQSLASSAISSQSQLSFGGKLDSGRFRTSGTVDIGLITPGLVTSSLSSLSSLLAPSASSSLFSSSSTYAGLAPLSPAIVSTDDRDESIKPLKAHDYLRLSRSSSIPRESPQLQPSDHLSSHATSSELLPLITPSVTSTPVQAHVTTYTYLTTYFKDGSMLVSSHEEKITNTQPLIEPSTWDLSMLSSSSMSIHPLPSLSVSSSLPPQLASSLAPLAVTNLTTFTYLTNFSKNGEITRSRQQEVTRLSSSPVLGPSSQSNRSNIPRFTRPLRTSVTESSVESASPELSLSSTSLSQPSKTLFTTFTYFTTYLRAGKKSVVSRFETVTNVEPDISTTEAVDKVKATSAKENFARIRPTPSAVTHFTTYTFYTTYVSAGKTHVSTSKKTVTDVHPVTVNGRSPTRIPSRRSTRVRTLVRPTPSAKTEYITFTYFTTSINRGTPIVTSRLETVTSVIPEVSRVKDEATIPAGRLGPYNEIEDFAGFTRKPVVLEPSISMASFASSSSPKVKQTTYSGTPTLPDIARSSARPSIASSITASSSLALKSPSNGTSIDLNDLLAGLKVPITHYTTYTYYTTLGLPSGSVTTMTRTQVVSNVVTDTIKLTGSLGAARSSAIRVTRTRLRDGLFTRLNRRQPLVDELEAVAGEHDPVHSPAPIANATHSNQTETSPSQNSLNANRDKPKNPALRPSASNKVDIESQVNTYKTQVNDPFLTVETTMIYRTTYYDGDTPTSSSTRKATKTEIKKNTLLDPSPSKKPVVVRRTRVRGMRLKSARPSKRPLIVITKKGEQQVTNTMVNVNHKTLVSPPALHVPHTLQGFGVDPNPVTYYTTYTHFTTELINGRPIVRSREQVISSVVRDRVLPTRAIIGLRSQPLPSSEERRHRSRRGLPNEMAQHLTDAEKQHDSILFANEENLMMEESDPKEVILTVDECNHQHCNHKYNYNSDDHTNKISGAIIASMQEPTESTVAASNLVKTSTTALPPKDEHQKSSDQEDLKDGESSKHASSPSLKTGLISSQINTMKQNDRLVFITTETYGTYIGTLYAQYAKTHTTSQDIKTQSSMGVPTVDSLQPTSTLDPSLPSLVSDHRASATGLINVTVRSVVNTDSQTTRTTLITTLIHGTFINGLYAHVGQVSSSVLEPSSATLRPVSTKQATDFNLISVSYSTRVSSDHAVAGGLQAFNTSSSGEDELTKAMSLVVDQINESKLSDSDPKTASQQPNSKSLTPVSESGRFLVFPTRKRLTTSTYIHTITTTVTQTQIATVSIPSLFERRSDVANRYFLDDSKEKLESFNDRDKSSSYRINTKVNQEGDYDQETDENIKLEDAVESPSYQANPRGHESESRFQYDDPYVGGGNLYPNPYSANQDYSNPSENYDNQPESQFQPPQAYPPNEHELSNDRSQLSGNREISRNIGTDQRVGFGMRLPPASSPLSFIDSGNPQHSGLRTFQGYSLPARQPQARTFLASQYQADPVERSRPASILPIGVPLRALNEDLYGRDQNVPPRRDQIQSSPRPLQPPLNQATRSRRPSAILKDEKDAYNPITRRPTATSRPQYNRNYLRSRQQSASAYRQRSRASSAVSAASIEASYLAKPQESSLERYQKVEGVTTRARNTKRIVLTNPSVSAVASTSTPPNVEPSFFKPTQVFPRSFYITSAPSLPAAMTENFLIDLPKSTLTVTSIVSVIRTLPIRHGFKTSYATITTTAFNTSVIVPESYQLTVNPTNTEEILTLFTRSSVDPTRIVDTLITTATLLEVKLVPIRIGFSTRTDTLTDTQVLTTFRTSERIIKPTLLFDSNIFLNAFHTSAPISYTVFTQTIVSPLIMTSTKIVSLALHGKTLLSTLTETHTSDVTLVTTTFMPVQPASTVAQASSTLNVPNQLVAAVTTQLTLQLTGDNGDVTELVTDITIPSSVLKTRARRDIRPTSSGDGLGRGLTVSQVFLHDLHPSPLGIPSPHHGTHSSSSSHPIYHSFHPLFSGGAHDPPSLSASFSSPENTIETYQHIITPLFQGSSERLLDVAMERP